MTKSNVKTPQRRQTNRRIEIPYDAVQQRQVHGYQQHQRVRRPERKEIRQWVAKMRRRFVNFSRWVKRLVSGSSKKLRSLDLRSSGADRFGPFDPNRKRNAGAAYLRAIFGSQLKMISTRDGKKV